MSIDLHDPVSAGQHVAKRARRRALETVEAARDVDLHGPAQTAKNVAKRTAKRAAREAAVATKRATKRAAKRTTKRASRRVARVILFAVVAGAAVGIAVTVAQRMRSASLHPDVAPDPFGAAVTEAEHERASI